MTLLTIKVFFWEKMHFFLNKNTKKVLVTLRDMCLIDVPPHGTPIFVKAKQGKYEVTSKSVNIQNNSARWPEPLTIKARIAASSTEKHTSSLRLSFRFEDVSGKDFTRYGIAEIDCTTAFYLNSTTCEMLLSNCTYNTKLKCLIEIHPADSVSLMPPPVDVDPMSLSETITQSNSSVTSTTSALVTNAATGGTTVRITEPKPQFEQAPVKISEKRYAELESMVVDLLTKIIIESADPTQ